jgi:hypothetical protein
MIAALGLEGADYRAMTLDGAALGIDGFDVLIEEDDCGGVLDVGRSGSFGGVEAPLRNRLLITAEPSGVGGIADQEEESRSQDAGE